MYQNVGPNSSQKTDSPGLRENWKQFTLLVIINGFVGGMVGMERTILPQFATHEFGIASSAAILSFIAAFGLAKAVSNYYTGRLANRLGRKNILLLGWMLALPIPFILMFAPAWNWVIGANILLGVSQGLAWSSTVVMKIDLAGEKNRGLAMGLNEFAGYLSMGLVAFFTGWIADTFGITPYPFFIGIGLSVAGLVLTLVWVRDTTSFVLNETQINAPVPQINIFRETTFKNKTLSAVTQAGFINNLNDGMIWGLLPIFLASKQLDNNNIGLITAIYPSVWGIGQLFTGKMADHFPRKKMLYWGMLLQGLAICLIPLNSNVYILAGISALLGLGTALVYPTFLTTIAHETIPVQRAESIGTFRLWRDLGYAVGAIVSGVTADIFGIEYAIYLIGTITMLSSIIIKFRMPTV